MSDNLSDLSKAGVSIWLDDLSRDRIKSGNLQDLIDNSSVVGVTTNPTIFAGAMAEGEAYSEQLREFKGKPVAEAITALTTTDVRDACDVFAPIFKKTDGVDGRVSIEVDPGMAMDPEATEAQAKQLSETVDRPNVLIKIPATKPGLGAITKTIGEGISVNVTLIFSIDRYQAVIDAYLDGLDLAKQNGHDLSKIHSVASFFVSRVDAEVDSRLDKLDSKEATALKGKAGIANARVAYGVYLDRFAGDRWEALAADGANAQRALWASTGTKNPDYDDTMYVTGLVAKDTVNTMPEKTMKAAADHGHITGDTITDNLSEAQQTLDDLKDVGIDLDDVVQQLEDEGVQKFVKSWDELTETVKAELDKA